MNLITEGNGGQWKKLVNYNHNSSFFRGLFPYYITLNIVLATIEIVPFYMAMGTISRVVYIETNDTNFILFFIQVS